MRLLTRVYGLPELHRVTSLLHSKGIPTFVESAGLPRGAPQWVVFACLNSQANDALKLLVDPEHVPANPVDVKEFDRVAFSSNLPTILRWSLVTLLVVASLFALMLYLQARP